jgi:ATP-dependent helicase/nuclease subunit A
VPHVAPEDNALMDSPEVRDLVAVLDVLASPGHDLSLAHALRSPLFGAADEDLVTLADAAAGGSWWTALARMTPRPPTLERAAMLLQRWQAASRALPPHDLLDRVVEEGDCIPRLLAAVPPARRQAAVEAVQSLLALSLRLDGARYASTYGFVRALKRRALTVSAGALPDAVQLLTVHGAKGLEAQAVILMDCDAPAARAETAAVLVDWPVDELAPRRCAFVASESRCPPSLAPLVERENAARAREELNGLYVAMTRARGRLVLSAVAPAQRSQESSWWSLVAPLAADWAPEPPVAAGKAGPSEPSYLALPAWRPAASAGNDAGGRHEAAAPEAARLGEALHRVLEWAAEPDAAPLPALVDAAAAAFDLSAEARSELQAHAQRVLASAELRRFFDPRGLAWAGNEVTVADGEQMLRIDRLVALGAGGRRTWWVLDYKLQADPLAVLAYREQLARYRAVVQGLQPGDEVRAAFVTAAGEVVELEPPAPQR